MKIMVKTLKGSTFPLQVQPQQSVAEVKRSIETAQGADVYPASQQMLIHQGKVLNDSSTLEENDVVENSFVVIMLSKNKRSGQGSSASVPTTKVPTAAAGSSVLAPTTTSTPVTNLPQPVSIAVSTPVPAPAPATDPAPPADSAVSGDVYDQASSNLVAGSDLEQTIQEILDMGGGLWDRDTVLRALRAAYNNPERAVDYLYSAIPEQAEAPPIAQSTGTGQPTNIAAVPQQPSQPASVPSSGPNVNPLNLFPEGLPNSGSEAAGGGALDFLQGNGQFQALRAMVQENPQILQPMLQELGKQNPQLVRLIQDHQEDFLRLINEPVDEEGMLGELTDAIPEVIEVTAEEREAIERLEAMGFDRNTVLEVYFACSKNEELAANYLLDHMNEFED